MLTPNKKCIFNCPFCISKTHKHNNLFLNNYENNHNVWKENLTKTIKNNQDLKTVVITGTNEPMQDLKCVYEIFDIIKKTRKEIQVELQTRYYKKEDIYEQLDIIAFSISNYYLLDKINDFNTTVRYVILLTDSFNNKSLDMILNKINNHAEQITFKVLQNSNGYNLKIDNWIEKHKIDNKSLNILVKQIDQYKGSISIKFDPNCMDAEDRYMVFREDGNLYKDFHSKERVL